VALATANLNAAAVRTWGSGTEAVVTNYDEAALEQFQAADVASLSLEEIFLAVAGEEGSGS
jgi:hypothetical protein